MVQPLKFRNEYVISSHTLQGHVITIHAGIKVNPCQEKWALVMLEDQQDTLVP